MLSLTTIIPMVRCECLLSSSIQRNLPCSHGDLESVEDTYTRNGSARFVSYIAAECVFRRDFKDDLFYDHGAENSRGDGGDLG